MTSSGPASMPQDFLLEIGTEELPAAAARAAAEQGGQLVKKVLGEHRLDVDPADISVWVTPRRIALYVRGLAPVQQSREIAERGPVAAKAFDEEGRTTRAAAGFARAKGVAVEELQVREHEGQRFVFAVHQLKGGATVDILPQACREILEGFYFPKTMRWNAGDMRFSRPVRWLLAKYGPLTVQFEAAGLKGADRSRGHRFLGDRVVEIANAADYREMMSGYRVTVDQDERRQAILEGLALEAGKLGASFIDPAGELEEVVYLVENPSVHAGDFGEGHLRLPERVLVTCMQSHQRYFPLTNEDGSLMAGFLYVMNGDPGSAPVITEGNERVLEGRIEDAEFSFDQDLKAGIEKMAGSLDKVIFHGRLGTLADKTVRLEALVEAFGGLISLCGPDLGTATAAARLAKADQVSIMVQEFPDLEGYIGAVYAQMEGYNSDICRAVEEHYLPVSAGGELPRTVPGAILSIADKVDNMVGAFAVDELPTGSRDPYGLRRAALGLAEISSLFGFDFRLEAYLRSSYDLYIAQKADVSRDDSVVASVLNFIYDRVQHRLVERGIPVEIVEAARAAAPESPLRLMALVEALDRFRSMPGFDDFHTAYFRSSKIAAKAAEQPAEGVDEELLQEDSERELYRTLMETAPEIEGLVGSRNYLEAMSAAARIRPAVDRFFDDVLVMAEEEGLRRNRLALVSMAAEMLLKLGDPILVAAAPEKAGH